MLLKFYSQLHSYTPQWWFSEQRQEQPVYRLQILSFKKWRHVWDWKREDWDESEEHAMRVELPSVIQWNLLLKQPQNRHWVTLGGSDSRWNSGYPEALLQHLHQDWSKTRATTGQQWAAWEHKRPSCKSQLVFLKWRSLLHRCSNLWRKNRHV